MLRDQDSALRIERAVHCSGHKETLKSPGFFFQERMMRNLFLDDPPLIKGKNHEITIPIGYDETVIVFLSENFPEPGREYDSSFFINDMVVLAPENRHGYPPTIIHFTPLSPTIRRE
jgi:hypothetical protein